MSWGAVCPVPVTETVDIIGYSWTYSFSFDSYCNVLSRLANWFVFVAYLAAAFIIAGVRNG
ncbi:virulence factor TspB C-terminal domain-related protein [Acinetobacter ursingii]|uniref:virulence factor TspB C-terminal domain-related protein n=1 Tax=Acinetobacter ursingii TaxID=108980 RepID=UPI003AF73696